MYKTFALNLLLAALYVLLGQLTFATSIEYSSVTSVVFAPEGIALAFVVLYGWRLAPAIVIGQALLSYWTGPSLLGGVAIGLFNAGASLVGAYLFTRWRISPQLNRLSDVYHFVIIVMGILQPISATGGVLVLLISGMSSPDFCCAMGLWHNTGIQKPLNSISLVPTAWLHWWIGNSIGQLLFFPLVISWLTPPIRTRSLKNALWGLLTASIGIAIIALVSFSKIHSAQLLLLAITYPLLVWTGLRHGFRIATVTNVIIAFMIMWTAEAGHGFISTFSEPNRFYYISFFITTTTLFSLTLFAMFEERRDLINQLTELASIDFLTTLYNRRFFLERAEAAFAEAKRHKQHVSIAILDIDHFKHVNDTYGHNAGDRVLKEMSYSCKKFLRREDLIGRFGGEEFALLFTNTALADAKLVIDRLLIFVSQCKIQIDSTTAIQITFSAGVAELDFNTDQSVNDTLNRADKMLYIAKKAGRNQVHAFKK